MPWIESHEDIWEHHRTLRLCALLNRPDYAVVGHLHSLWHFTLRNAWRDANLGPWGDAGIERAARWDGEAGAMVAALRDVGFLDESTVHGWIERAGKLVQDRLYNEDRKKNAAHTQKNGVLRRKADATLPYPTVPNPTVPDHTLEDTTGEDGQRAKDARTLTARLVELVRRNDPKARIPADLGRWETEADRLLRKDALSMEEAARVLEWAQADDFWKANVLSMGKFREKFHALKLKMAGGARVAAANMGSTIGDRYAHLES